MVINKPQAIKLINKYKNSTEFMQSEIEDVLNGITTDAREICYVTPLKIKYILIGYRSAVDVDIRDFSDGGRDKYFVNAESDIDSYLRKGNLSAVTKILQDMASAALENYDEYIILLED